MQPNDFRKIIKLWLAFCLAAVVAAGCSIAGTQTFQVINYRHMEIQSGDTETQIESSINKASIQPSTSSRVLDTTIASKEAESDK